MVTKKKPRAKQVYTATIKVLGKVYEAKGTTIPEAIVGLTPGGVAKGMSILTMTKGKIRKERILNGPQTFRLFNGGRIMREVALKNVSLFFSPIDFEPKDAA